VIAHTIECFGDGGFDRPAARRVDARSSRRESKHGAPSIAGIIDACQKPLCHQPLEHTGQRTGMHVQDGRQLAR